MYGYTTHPDRNTGTATGDWGDATNGPMNTLNTVQNMKRVLRADRFYPPYVLYVNDTNWTDIGMVMNATNTQRVVEVLQRDPELAMVKNAPRLNAGEVVMVSLLPRSVQWVEAFSIRPVEWDEKGSLGSNFRVIGAGAPLIKSTATGECGIAHFTHAT